MAGPLRPSARAAATKSRARTDAVVERVTRAKTGSVNSAIAVVALQKPVPSAAASIIAERSGGKAKSTSAPASAPIRCVRRLGGDQADDGTEDRGDQDGGGRGREAVTRAEH